MKNIHKVLILGSGAIKIGQAGEFDYSGSQAIKALKEENVEIILINPNIATIQTSEHMADKVYFLPLTVESVTQIIEKDRPDEILLSFGGQTALNVGIELAKSGILKSYSVEVLGTPIASIINTEDRNLFVENMQEADLKVAKSKVATTVEDALVVAEEIGFPVMARIAYALGGLGSGIAKDKKELKEIAQKALSHTEQILIEEYLGGWKEVEYEIVRDHYDNCIVVCSMENLDPMGIHTGESIVVSPVQTLNASENFMLRSIAIRAAKHLGIVGECNIQYALDPESSDYRIIEINARLSRSSALASKATGYPLAFVAAKLNLGYSLTELKNSVTQKTTACFEPALDYITVKYPRWDLSKFSNVDNSIGSEMKSVGEVMAIGRTFEEALQKAIRMLDEGYQGVIDGSVDYKSIAAELKRPTNRRIFAIASAFENEYSPQQIHELTGINLWFLYKIQNIVEMKKQLESYHFDQLTLSVIKRSKQLGFSDMQIGEFTGADEQSVRNLRKKHSIIPYVKQIDTLAAEYPAQTNYLYLTYNASEHDLPFNKKNQIAVLGSGPYRIGSSVEFDWCCVNTILSLKAMDYKTIMINCNPETVSTDYDIADKLYFEELSFERVLDILEYENPFGVVVSVAGQIPNGLANPLYEAGQNILGTSPQDIDRAEDRNKFSHLLDTLGIAQPEWKEITSVKDTIAFAEKVHYPVLIRPSYVLSGAAMSVALNEKELKSYLKKASQVSHEHPVVISKFITEAREIDMDAVAKNGELVCYAILEHVENAGVHSGDATLVLPPQRTYLETLRRIKKIAKRIASALQISGPFNIQFLAKENEIKVIECNLRASRSFPFVSKVLKINFIDLTTKILMKKSVEKIHSSSFDLDYVSVKAPEFSFTRLKGSDPIQTVEMTSTGEVACIGDNFNEALLKSLLSVGFTIPKKNILISSGPISSKASLMKSVRKLKEMGYDLYATKGTADFISENGIDVQILYWPLENQEPNVVTYIEKGKIDLVINIPKNCEKEELDNDYIIRRKSIDFNVPLLTNPQLTKRFIDALYSTPVESLKPKSWDEYY